MLDEERKKTRVGCYDSGECKTPRGNSIPHLGMGSGCSKREEDGCNGEKKGFETVFPHKERSRQTLTSRGQWRGGKQNDGLGIKRRSRMQEKTEWQESQNQRNGALSKEPQAAAVVVERGGLGESGPGRGGVGILQLRCSCSGKLRQGTGEREKRKEGKKAEMV